MEVAAPIQAVVFDVGRVIVEWDMRLLIRKLIADEAEVDWVYAHVLTPEWHFRHDAGEPLDELLRDRIAEFPQYEGVLRAYATRFNETIPGEVPGTRALIEQLDARGVPLFAITNFAATFWPSFTATMPDLIGRFRDVVVSGVEKLAKPDHQIFRLAERRFGYPAQALLFIDDSLPNVIAARECGWEAHHFVDALGLEAELQGRGLLG